MPRLDMAPEGLWLYMSCMLLLGICPCVIKGSLLPGTVIFEIKSTELSNFQKSKGLYIPFSIVSGPNLTRHTTILIKGYRLCPRERNPKMLSQLPVSLLFALQEPLIWQDPDTG